MYISRFRILFLTFSLFIFFYTFFKSEIYWDEKLNHYYQIYYYISYFLIFLSVLFFFINKEKFIYVYITLITLVVCLYLIETYLTFFTIYRGSLEIHPKKIQIYKEKTGLDYDTRQKFEIYDDLKKKDTKIEVAMGPMDHPKGDIYTLSGISNVQTILCNENGSYAIYQSDRYGFRNNDKEWDAKEIEYLIIGDSFSISECVDTNQTLSSVLGNISNKSSITLGFGGNGPLTEYATLKEYIQPNIKKIIWIYTEGNDQANLDRELNSKILKKYLIDKSFKQNLKSKILLIDNLLKEKVLTVREKLEYKFERSFVYKLVKFIKFFNTRDKLKYLIKGINVEKRKINPEFKKILRSAKNISNTNGSELYFVYVPSTSVIWNSCSKRNTHFFDVKKIIKNNLDIKFISLCDELFNKENDPLRFFPFRMDGHFNPLGYEEIAKVIYRKTNKSP
jgi:hypothetical protein